MSRKKTKTVNKNLLANSHIESEMRDNQLLRPLKIKKNKKLNEKQKLFLDISLDDKTQLML